MALTQKINALADWLDFSDPASPFFRWLAFIIFIGALIGTGGFVQAVLFTVVFSIPIGLAVISGIFALKIFLHFFAWGLSLFASQSSHSQP